MIVAVQCMRLPSASGNAEIPGVGESMRVISSDCRLQEKRLVSMDVGSRFPLYSGESTRSEACDVPFGDTLGIRLAGECVELVDFRHTGCIWCRVLGVFH